MVDNKEETIIMNNNKVDSVSHKLYYNGHIIEIPEKILLNLDVILRSSVVKNKSKEIVKKYFEKNNIMSNYKDCSFLCMTTKIYSPVQIFNFQFQSKIYSQENFFKYMSMIYVNSSAYYINSIKRNMELFEKNVVEYSKEIVLRALVKCLNLSDKSNECIKNSSPIQNYLSQCSFNYLDNFSCDNLSKLVFKVISNNKYSLAKNIDKNENNNSVDSESDSCSNSDNKGINDLNSISETSEYSSVGISKINGESLTKRKQKKKKISKKSKIIDKFMDNKNYFDIESGYTTISSSDEYSDDSDRNQNKMTYKRTSLNDLSNEMSRGDKKKYVKNQITIDYRSEEEKTFFKLQEIERYKHPHLPWIYYSLDGEQQSIVCPVIKKTPPFNMISKPRDHELLKKERPSTITILCLTRDAASRLKTGVGTRADICDLIKDSFYINHNISETQISSIVSGALDRLHYDKDQCVKYDSQQKLWMYLHGNRDHTYSEWNTHLEDSNYDNPSLDFDRIKESVYKNTKILESCEFYKKSKLNNKGVVISRMKNEFFIEISKSNLQQYKSINQENSMNNQLNLIEEGEEDSKSVNQSDYNESFNKIDIKLNNTNDDLDLLNKKRK